MVSLLAFWWQAKPSSISTDKMWCWWQTEETRQDQDLCGWQVWDVEDRFELLVTDCNITVGHQHQWFCYQHLQIVTIIKSPRSLSMYLLNRIIRISKHQFKTTTIRLQHRFDANGGMPKFDVDDRECFLSTNLKPLPSPDFFLPIMLFRCQIVFIFEISCIKCPISWVLHDHFFVFTFFLGLSYQVWITKVTKHINTKLSVLDFVNIHQ